MRHNGEYDSRNENIHMLACGSADMVRNGTNRCGNAQDHWKDCGTSRVLKPKQVDSETEKATALQAGLERCSLRGVERIFDIARQTVPRWRATPVLATWVIRSKTRKERVISIPYHLLLICLMERKWS